MSVENKFSVIIPLREGSKGLPNKNIRILNDKPLYLHAVDLAKQANSDRIILSTNIKEILNSQLDASIELLNRPNEISTDSTEMSPVLIHAIEELSISGTVVLLQATSPLRSLKDLNKSLELFENSGSDIVLSVTSADSGVLKWGELSTEGIFKPLSENKYVFSNRQTLPSICKPNGAIYIFNAEWLIEKRDLKHAEKISGIEMPAIRSHDIDTIEDLIICEKILRNSEEIK